MARLCTPRHDPACGQVVAMMKRRWALALPLCSVQLVALPVHCGAGVSIGVSIHPDIGSFSIPTLQEGRNMAGRASEGG